MEPLVIPVPTDFNYTECLSYLNRNSFECLHRVDGECIIKLVLVHGELVPLHIRFVNYTLVVEGLNCALSEEVRPSIGSFLQEWLDIDRDLSCFYTMAAGDPVLKHPVQTYRGLRLIGIPDLFEALVWAVLGQQINIQFAYTLKKRLVEAFGERMEVNGYSLYAFPSVSIIAACEPSALRKFQLTERKAEYLVGIARLIHEGGLTKEGLLQSDTGAIEKKMLSIHGVGMWTAHYIMMKCLKIMTAFPLADVGLHNAIRRQLHLPAKPTIKDIGQMAMLWRGWEAYAVFYLWRSLI